MNELKEYKVVYIDKRGDKKEHYVQAKSNFHARKYLSENLCVKKIISVMEVTESLSLF